VQRIYLVPGSSLLALAASNATGPSVSAALPFQFPRPVFVTGLLVVPLLNAGGDPIPKIQAGLALSVFDENQEALVSDGRGSQFVTSTGALAPAGADCLLMSGFGFRPFPLQRKGFNSARWLFSVQNRVALATTLAGIYLYAEDPS
jgi:hypothetical protein